MSIGLSLYMMKRREGAAEKSLHLNYFNGFSVLGQEKNGKEKNFPCFCREL